MFGPLQIVVRFGGQDMKNSGLTNAKHLPF